MIDDTTGMVMYEKNADTPIPPASMSKLMTLYMLFEAIRDGRVTNDTEFLVTPHAQSMEGSRMFVEAGTKVRVADLIQGIIVQSGNDACVVVAEGLAGSEPTFAEQMTKRAQELGMTQSRFANASGLPDPGHVMSARDLVILARRIIDDFPEEYDYFSETEYTWNGIKQHNRNPLLELGLGVDGLKTGHTAEAGYGLVGSAHAERPAGALHGRRPRQREGARRRDPGAGEVGLRRLRPDPLLRGGRHGDRGRRLARRREDRAGGRARRPPHARPARGAQRRQGAVVYQGPIEAPIAKGQKLATLEVDGPRPRRRELRPRRRRRRAARRPPHPASAPPSQLSRDQALSYLPGREGGTPADAAAEITAQ